MKLKIGIIVAVIIIIGGFSLFYILNQTLPASEKPPFEIGESLGGILATIILFWAGMKLGKYLFKKMKRARK